MTLTVKMIPTVRVTVTSICSLIARPRKGEGVTNDNPKVITRQARPK